MMNSEFEHAPLAKLDYGFDWSARLDSGEIISTSTWTVDAGMTKTNEQVLNNVTSLYVEGGEVGKKYKLVNSIVTSLGKKDSRTITLFCKLR